MTTAFVATIGGHISELVELAGRMPEGEQVWVTNQSAQTQDLMERQRDAGHHVEFVPFIGERDHAGVLRAIPQARRIYKRYGVRRVVSTGSAIALSYLPAAALTGLDAHYIESSTRVASCSVTGKILARMPGVDCWWQFDPAPAGFSPIGGVYDRFGARPIQRLGPEGIRRIVVTVGTTDRDFRRLIARLVSIIPQEVEVVWQTGHTDVSGLGINAEQLLPEATLIAAIEQADVVISHAGAGSLALALKAGRVPVYVPRRAEHGEQIDDHQVELARWADAQGLAVMAEADAVSYQHLLAAAGREVTRNPVKELVLK